MTKLNRTQTLSSSQVETLGNLLEMDLRGESITDHDVASLLQHGADSSLLYRAGQDGTDAQFKRIVKAARAARQERDDMALVSR